MTDKTDDGGPTLTPLEELLAQKCWVHDCRNLAAFRDGKGWWWCITHEDRREDWGIDKIANYDEVVKRGMELKMLAEGKKQTGGAK